MMGKKKVSTNWYVHHQDRMEWYESQEAAIDAVDLLMSSYEDGIWSGEKSYFSLGHADGETVDSDLFNRRNYTNALTRSCISSIFTIDLFTKTKENWISKYGSNLLRQSLRAGYDCHDGYLAQRLAHDYPGFKINDRLYQKVDTPSERCFLACLKYEYAHCSSDRENYYITIDNYLGKYQLIKLIDISIEITSVADPVESIGDKENWIFEYGSNLLQQSFMAGYDCNDRYLQERVVYDYPGFTINPGKYQKVDSPSESCLYACLGYENSYCSSHDSRSETLLFSPRRCAYGRLNANANERLRQRERDYYITIDLFLGKYQLIKLIDLPTQISALNSPIAANNVLRLKIMKLASSSSIKSAIVTPLGLAQLISICTITGTIMYITIDYLPRIFQAIVSNL